MSDKLTDGDKLDLLYHQICREVAKDLGGTLIGATRGRGFSMYYKGKAVEIEGGYRMLVEDQQAEITRLRTELAEAQQAADGLEATLANAMDLIETRGKQLTKTQAERDTLREQLRVAREGLDYLKNGTVPAMVQHIDDTVAKLDKEQL